MKGLVWWRPGGLGGLLSRKWAQVFVFPLPPLSPEERESSLRYRVQALLPASDVPLLFRTFEHRGQSYGLVIVDRLPDPKPSSNLALGFPLVLPRTWPERCLLAVASPEGWEIQRYDKGVLAESFPPFQEGSSALKKVLDQNPNDRVFWVAPVDDLVPPPPKWAEPAPPWNPSRRWGVPWQPPSEPRWPWVLAALLLAIGIAGWSFAAWQNWDVKQERNQNWEHWLQTARPLVETPSDPARLEAARALKGESWQQVLSTLAEAWPEGVEIRRLEVFQGKVLLTAQAESALKAVAALAAQPKGANFKVLQIRPSAGKEEFDMEGKSAP